MLHDTLLYTTALTSASALVLASVNPLAAALVTALALALARALARVLEAETAGAGRPIPALVALAVRVLPAGQRPHYREVFRGELGELSRRERLGYALRVLVRAWELRRALVEAVCAPDGTPARRVER